MPSFSILPPVLPKPSQGHWTGAVIVLPEIFGLNCWVRGVADRLSAAGVPALAMPLFARTAPELELGYDPESTSQGRRHTEATSAMPLCWPPPWRMCTSAWIFMGQG